MTEAKNGRQTGRVTLLGAGCHDVSWLTLAGKQALQQADVVICDDLIDRSLLSLAPQAQFIAMGKRGHRKSASQEAINEQMAALAGQNREVVRLKGGDPMVFGRGMEEAEYLRRRGIDVRILPGISSFLGVPAKEQLALTLRGCSRGFMVLTAASAHGQRTARQWKTIADFEGTRVFLMGMSQIDSIARSLMEAGLDGETRCAAMTSPAMTCTKSVYAPLRDLAVQCETAHLASPGILLIGGSVPEKPLLDFVRIGFVCTGRLQARIADRLPARFQCVSLAKIQTQVFEHSWKERLNEIKRPD